MTDSVTLPSGTVVALAGMPAYAAVAYMVNNAGTGTIGTYSYDGTMANSPGNTKTLSNVAALWFDPGAAGVPSLYAIGGTTFDPIKRYPLSGTPPSAPTIGSASPDPIFSAPSSVNAIGGTNLSLTGGGGSTDCITFIDTVNGTFTALADNGSTLPAAYSSSAPYYSIPSAPAPAITAFAVGQLGDLIFWVMPTARTCNRWGGAGSIPMRLQPRTIRRGPLPSRPSCRPTIARCSCSTAEASAPSRCFRPRASRAKRR